MTGYLVPENLTVALAAVAGGARALAGGTDLYPIAGRRLAFPVVDLCGLPELAGISATESGLRIGSCTNWSTVAEADLPPSCHALQQSARQVGGRQIQNVGTVGGNLCNASPAADGIPPLLILRAEVELASTTGIRRLALEDFLLGPRHTALRPDEVLTAIHLPKAGLAGRSAFQKLGARAYLVISIAMVAARLVVSDGRIVEAAVAIGSCGPVACRLPLVEAALLGPVAKAPDRVQPKDVAVAISPIDDIRATADYRRSGATELVRRAVAKALS